MLITCFTCGLPGHVANSCPNASHFTDPSATDSKPMWCGECDSRTRLRETSDDRMVRCKCHPLSHKPLVQHVVCPRCKVTTVHWDNADCGSHHVAGVQGVFVGPPPVPDEVWQAQRRIGVEARDPGEFTSAPLAEPEYVPPF